jgi:hypothetical protein
VALLPAAKAAAVKVVAVKVEALAPAPTVKKSLMGSFGTFKVEG